MDTFEERSNDLLQRLLKIREEQWTDHVEKQIDRWYTKEVEKPDSQDVDADERTIGCYLSNIRHLERIDSDATESTSSSDSYDELENFSHEDIPAKRGPRYYQRFPPPPPSSASNASSHQYQNQNYSHQNPNLYDHADFNDLKKKAIWKWAHDRSRIAARWTWLRAQVNDLEFRIRSENQASLHAKALKSPPIPQTLPENACSRTVPISKDFRRRRLIKSSQILSDSTKRLVKTSHVPCICTSLPQTVAPCLSCNGRYNYLRQIDGDNMPLGERISLLDPRYHPVLSFPDDLTLGSQISYLLKQEKVNRKPAKGRPGRKKGSTAANLAAAAAAAAAAGSNGEKGKPGRKSKYYSGVGRPPGSGSSLHTNQSQSMILSNRVKRKYRKHSNTNNYGPNWAGNPNKRNKGFRRASSMNENWQDPFNQPSGVGRRRRSEQSAYDIDNIVIPLSVAATTRVEILEYKEIMTPSWRVWENGTCNSSGETQHRHQQQENNDKEETARASEGDEVNDEYEDTSDEAYALRHSKGESEEKKRFRTKN